MLSVWRRNVRFRTWILLAVGAISYGAVMVLLTPMMADRSSLEAAFPHLAQARAMLDGHLALSDDIGELDYGLAWYRSQLQQVWGLGIGLWLIPFEVVHRLLGQQVQPEPTGLGAAFSLLAFYSVQTGRKLASRGKVGAGIALVWATLASPPLWTLCRSTHSVFEETAVYALLGSLGLLTAMVRVLITGALRDYSLACGLAAFAPFLRPTHALYGAVTVALCAFHLRREGKSLIRLWSGFSLVAIGWVLLGVSNEVRFGKPWEFGHRLTITSPEMTYLTRFGNPYAEADPIAAARELAGMLFCTTDVVDGEVFSNRIVPWQVPLPRWRRFDFSGFSWVWPLVCLTGIVVLLQCQKFAGEPSNRIEGRGIDDRMFLAALAFWGWAGVIGLSAFYLRFPVMSSRYLTDFAPGLLAQVLVVAIRLSALFPRLAGVLLAGWWLWEIGGAKVVPSPPGPLAPIEAATPTVSTRAIGRVGESYSHPQKAKETGIVGNGDGWDLESKRTQQVVILMVDSPELVELTLESLSLRPSAGATATVCRALMGGDYLVPLSTTVLKNKVTAAFAVPERFRSDVGPVGLILCFGDQFNCGRELSTHRLVSVRWR